MESTYDPKKAEKRWYSVWVEEKLFTPRKSEGTPFVIVMPPPNITGMLTIGHVLNLSLQDTLIRWNILEGRECLWLPGKDHAGIATQNAVERQISTQGMTRHDLGRERFVSLVWQWKEKMDRKITEQIMMLGCACDWSRERFTMDEDLSLAVRTAFVKLYHEGLIYRDEYVINSCPRCLTTLADDEVEREEVNGVLYYIRYPRIDSGYVTVATTRPETMLGDVAVAVNPADARYRSLISSTLILPIVGRKIPIIADEFVDPEFGTGAVKVTPAHDADDFEIAKRHNLERVVVIDQDGIMNQNAGRFSGLDRFEARKRIVEGLKNEGLIEKIEPYTYSIGKCYRCSTIVEPYLSKQFFVRMKPLAQPAIEAVKRGDVRFHPERWTKIYFNWLENIRDWCISRQLWWGHRIPVWYCKSCDFEIVSVDDPDSCPSCGGEVIQEDDVLDTWFSSWLWPISTLGWPKDTEDLRRYYPTSVLVTGFDIIFFWVARMIMAGLHFKGDVPFRDVYIHGLIRDQWGRKMSKSLGNSPDPAQLVEIYGADALRFAVVSLSPRGSDLLFSERSLETGRNFANKVWNAARLIRPHVGKSGERIEGDLEVADRWILSRTCETIREVTGFIESFELNQAAKRIYYFIWHEFCDWYLELAKQRLYGGDSNREKTAATIATKVMKLGLRLLHPFMPFLTEEVWSNLGFGEKPLLASSKVDQSEFARDYDAEKQMEGVMGIVETVRNIRGEMGIHPGKQITIYLLFPEVSTEESILKCQGYIQRLAKVSDIKLGKPYPSEAPFATGLVNGIEINVVLSGLIDIEAEKNRISKEIKRVQSLLEGSERKLADNSFLEKAPHSVVEKEREKVTTYRKSLEKLQSSLRMLG
ncbi:MAG: valine--tRNA ligase [bacterium]